MRNVILVHGFWHGSWCWSPITARLAARGIPSVAVDLDGHGLGARAPRSRWSVPFDPQTYATEPSPVAGITASSAAATLIEQVRTIGGGRPCVVVAHSMSGPVVTLAAEREPGLFAHIQYVSAFAPVSGHATADYIGLPENAGDLVAPLLAADPAVVGALRIRTDDHAALRECFYGDVEPARAEAAIALLSVDGPMGIPGEAFPVTRARFGAVPHSYVMCTRDNAVRPELQRRLIRELDAVSAAPTKVFELDSSHSPFLSRPDELTDAIETVVLP
ncbi:alpha/beta fold hydrolase [Paractinoplanes lichenicola]|uniref:Alpha/beta hydrolase n=1 Tax=Paractinoplanes lichenicola TaxID=2802976 RepID=A0ABS1W3K4_9ACTN|nr:alpha/beta fold hydrolase [Actinoplanes lichenicola]MBL7261311.1 alpha/beta hydrolase [Actinoplanes lichenicola]